MAVPIHKDALNEGPISSWNKSFSSNSQSFFGNWDNLPVDVLFSVVVTAAPVFVTLTVPSYFPVGNLTLFGAVCSLLTTAACFNGWFTDLKASGAMSRNNGLLLKQLNKPLKQMYILDMISNIIFI